MKGVEKMEKLDGILLIVGCVIVWLTALVCLIACIYYAKIYNFKLFDFNFNNHKIKLLRKSIDIPTLKTSDLLMIDNESNLCDLKEKIKIQKVYNNELYNSEINILL